MKKLTIIFLSFLCIHSAIINRNEINGANNLVYFGQNNEINGRDNRVIGFDNHINGRNNTALGKQNSLDGNRNIVAGYGNNVSGQGSFVSGEGNTIMGPDSIPEQIALINQTMINLFATRGFGGMLGLSQQIQNQAQSHAPYPIQPHTPGNLPKNNKQLSSLISISEYKSQQIQKAINLTEDIHNAGICEPLNQFKKESMAQSNQKQTEQRNQIYSNANDADGIENEKQTKVSIDGSQEQVRSSEEIFSFDIHEQAEDIGQKESMTKDEQAMKLRIYQRKEIFEGYKSSSKMEKNNQQEDYPGVRVN